MPEKYFMVTSTNPIYIQHSMFRSEDKPDRLLFNIPIEYLCCLIRVVFFVHLLRGYDLCRSNCLCV